MTDTKIAAGFVLHSGDGVEGVVKVGDACEALVDYDRRSNIAPNHTMTHVINYALRAVLGDGVDQKGSLVDDEKLRFDFSHNKAMSPKEIEQVEAIVRDQVSKKLAVDTREVPLAQAQAISGLRAVFGEVYPDPVRVVSVGPSIDELLAEPAKEDWKSYSIEFCGGTHLGNTGEADDFVILSEEGIAKGIRRVVGATRGAAAAANAAADEVAARVKACDGLSGAELEKEMATLKGVVDTAIMPATRRAVIRDAMTAKTKAMIAAAKAAKEEAKAAAVKAVGEKAEAAKSAGAAHFVARLSDSTDPAALKDAAAVAFKAGVACALFACDPVKGKAMCYVSVPPAVEGSTSRGGWTRAAAPSAARAAAARAAPRRDRETTPTDSTPPSPPPRRSPRNERIFGTTLEPPRNLPAGRRFIPRRILFTRRRAPSKTRAESTAERVATSFHARASYITQYCDNLASSLVLGVSTGTPRPRLPPRRSPRRPPPPEPPPPRRSRRYPDPSRSS